MNFLVVGGRDFTSKGTFDRAMTLLSFPKDTVFFSRHVEGASIISEDYGRYRGFTVIIYPAGDNELFRDLELVDRVDVVIHFKGGEDKDAEQFLGLARKAKRAVVVFDYKGNICSYEKLEGK